MLHFKNMDIDTALGDIPTQPTEFIIWVLSRAIALGGGIAFILIVFGAFQILTSSGDPDKVKSGRDLITAALSGLLFILFSVFLLQLIGVEIFQIPGLT